MATASENASAQETRRDYKLISSDSHISEPPDLFEKYIDPKFRDRAPHVAQANGADVYVLEGAAPVRMGSVCAAGRDPQEISSKFMTYDQMHRGGWDPAERLIAQDQDGLIAEIIYPTVGMVIGLMPDLDLQHACAQAYNRWLADFCSHEPRRLIGVGQTVVRSVSEAIDELGEMKEMGFRGVMLPAQAGTEFDYDDLAFDPLWEAAVALDFPVSFHVFAGNRKDLTGASTYRGTSPISMWPNGIRQNQDIINMLIFNKVFDRHPDLRMVCVEADAGWAPHFKSRMDHLYRRHRHWLSSGGELSAMPSDLFDKHIYLTFQDDVTAFRSIDQQDHTRLLWANDYPHSDATWPWSERILEEQASGLTYEQRRAVLHDNTKALYRLEVA